MYATLDKLRLAADAGPQQPALTMRPLPSVRRPPCPRSRRRRVYLCAAGDVMLAVTGRSRYTSAGLEDEAFLELLANEAAEKRCFDAKPLYRAALPAGAAQNIILTQSWPPIC